MKRLNERSRKNLIKPLRTEKAERLFNVEIIGSKAILKSSSPRRVIIEINEDFSYDYRFTSAVIDLVNSSAIFNYNDKYVGSTDLNDLERFQIREDDLIINLEWDCIIFD